MAVTLDPVNGDIIIGGFDQGIGKSPYAGLTDMRNIEIISIPGEAPINFATALQTPQISALSVSSASGATITLSAPATGLLVGMAIFFPSVGSFSGVSTGTPYWISAISPGVNPTSLTLSSTYTTNTAVTITGSAGVATISTYNVGFTPGGFSGQGSAGITYFQFDEQNYWGVDSVGQVWSTLTPLNNGQWAYTGNTPPVTNFYSGTPVFSTAGNGLVFYESTSGQGYIFVFHGSSIDYTKAGESLGTFGWNYQWTPSAGTNAGFDVTPTPVLNSPIGFTGSHMALAGQDNAIYYCDGNTLGSIVPTNSATFDPLIKATYTFSGGGNIASGAGFYALQLPANDNAQCLAELGINLLIGGQLNKIYPWNRTGSVQNGALFNSFSYPIFLGESNIVKMVTVNTNTYCLVGNRGRIYQTNGTQAQEVFKVPDHLSGGISPFFSWGGLAFNRNELYFGCWATTNAGVALTGNNAYGGVWAVNVETGAMRLINQLSYGSYAGYATAITPQYEPNSSQNAPLSGAGLHIGWSNAVPTPTAGGIDSTTSLPYTGGQAYIVSDMIPVGTNLVSVTPSQIEYKLSSPLLAGESVQILTAKSVNGSFTSWLTSPGDGARVSDISVEAPDQEFQWLLVKIILTGISSSPSFNRLTQIRVKGATSKDNIATQPFAIQ